MQVAGSFARTSPVTRGTARTARRMADLRAGEAKAPSSPRHLVRVDQFANRRRAVDDACGPTDFRKPWGPKVLVDVYRHSMIGIRLAALRSQR